MSEEHS